MKIQLLPVLLAFTFSASAQLAFNDRPPVVQAAEETVNPAAVDEIAIKTVVEAETAAYHAGKIDIMLSHWNFAAYARGMATTLDGQTLYGEGDQLRQFFSTLTATNNTFANSNYNIKVGGDMAWATYDQKTMKADGSTALLSHEVRGLEKVNGVWKIILVSAHHYKP
jgi:SnoaL-like domain